MGNMIDYAEQVLAEKQAEAERLLLEKYLKMVGVAKHDFSNAFRKHLNIATGVDMDTALTTERIFNPSETKIARTLIDDMKGDEDILYVIRSRSSKESEEEAAEKEQELEDKGDVKESLLTMFEKKMKPEEEPKEEPKDEVDEVRDFGSDGHSKSGDVSDEDAKEVVDNTELEHFFVLTNIERLGKRIAPDLPSPPAMHLYMINNLTGEEDKPLKATVINATLSVLVDMLRSNTSTVNFVYKVVAKKEHSQHLKVAMKVIDDEGAGEQSVAPSELDDTSDASADEMNADKTDKKPEEKEAEKPEGTQSAIVANPLDSAHKPAAEEPEAEEETGEKSEDDDAEEDEEKDDKKQPTFPLKKKVPEGFEVGGKFKLTEDIGTYDEDRKFVLGLRKGAIVEMVDLMAESVLNTVKVKHITNREVFTVELDSIEGYNVGK